MTDEVVERRERREDEARRQVWVLVGELPRGDALGDDRLDCGDGTDEDPLREPVVDRAVLGPMVDLNELVLIRLGADLTDGSPEREQALDGGETWCGGASATSSRARPRIPS